MERSTMKSLNTLAERMYGALMVQNNSASLRWRSVNSGGLKEVDGLWREVNRSWRRQSFPVTILVQRIRAVL